jgi:cytochrome c biogenesis protein CcmG/thiol:disulfide interchange protein DsbE
MNKTLINALPLAVFLALTLALAALLLRPQTPEMISRPMPPLSVEGLSAADIKGPALVNFFASWCTPCRAEHETLMKIARENKIPVYGIAYKDKKADTEKYLRELGNPYKKIGHDDKGRAFIDWGLSGVPETFVIDGAGNIRYHHAGVLLEEHVKATILPLLSELEKDSEK